MEYINHLILGGSLLVLVSIFAGLVSNRFGAPLLLVFLGLGILVGEDGLGGIVFTDFNLAYLVGSMALAIVLFDGGLRTQKESFQVAAWPATTLATVGVLLTVAVIAAIAHFGLGFDPLMAFLIGAVVGSTDAAAVFFLLNVRGMKIQKRVSATLEVESGLNDPMAIFLTLLAVLLIEAQEPFHWWHIPTEFLVQMIGGGAIGFAGGMAMVWLINRVELASGLYPIFAVAAAMALFGAGQSLDASGYLAVYIAGLIVGNRRHRATQLIARFHDGLAWLSQIVMFLMLGLLITPHNVLPDLTASIVIAVALVFVARPIAVFLCLVPFRFTLRETLFVSWVGLRGAVPIFLATVPILAGLPGAMTVLSIAFVVVAVSLGLQGWTIGRAARVLDLELPAASESERIDIAVAGRDIDRDIAAYRAADNCAALGYPYREIPLPRRARILAVIRDGVIMTREKLERLQEDDLILCVAPPEQLMALDQLFAARRSARQQSSDLFGEFTLEGASQVGLVADFYCFPASPAERVLTLADFVHRRLRRRPVVGDRVMLGSVELVVQEMEKGKVRTAGIELDPAGVRWARHPVLRRLRRAVVGGS
jgi:cell volume regulation protein A